jgi:hypothetical protein
MYFTHTIVDGQPVFILASTYEEKHIPRGAGFTWGKPLANAWATSDMAVVRNIFVSDLDVKIDLNTLNYIKQHTAMTDTTYDRWLTTKCGTPNRKEEAGVLAALLTDQQVTLIHQALKVLASVCDGALKDDRAGFNRNDIEFGHSMADAPSLNRNQAAYGKLMLEKYRGQLGEELYEGIFPELFAKEQADAAAKATKAAQKEADRADKKAEKAAPKLHKKGLPCEWSACTDSICMANRHQVAALRDAILTDSPVEDQQPVPLGYTAADGQVVVTQPEAIVVMSDLDTSTPQGFGAMLKELRNDLTDLPTVAERPQAPVITHVEVKQPETLAELVTGDEAARLANSLATCHPADFDTIVDLLRDLRKIDAPKETGGNDFLKAAWTAAGQKAN